MFGELQMQILATLCSQPDREFGMSELGVILRRQPGVFQRGLNSLEDQGYVSSRRRGNQRLFRINRGHPFFPEIRKIAEKSLGAESLLGSLVNKISGVTLAFIYGSYVEDRMRPDSDIDLLIVCENDAAEESLLDGLPAVERKLQREVNYKLYRPDEFRRRRQSGDPFLNEVLSGRHVVLKGDV
jgi:predicted nucleotidyltransferase